MPSESITSRPCSKNSYSATAAIFETPRCKKKGQIYTLPGPT